MKTFVDNVCRQVIERHLLRYLPSIFCPESVAAYSDDELQRVAGETSAIAAKRRHLESLRDDLKPGLHDLGHAAGSIPLRSEQV